MEKVGEASELFYPVSSPPLALTQLPSPTPPPPRVRPVGPGISAPAGCGWGYICGNYFLPFP